MHDQLYDQTDDQLGAVREDETVSQQPSSRPQSKAAVVAFSLRGTLMSTTTDTLSACEPDSLLGRVAAASALGGGDNDHRPIFIDCSAADFNLVLDYLCFGAVPGDAPTRERLASVAGRLRMPLLRAACLQTREGGRVGHSEQQTKDTHAVLDAETRHAAIAEMKVLVDFVMDAGRRSTYNPCDDKRARCRWAIERHAQLDRLVFGHPLSAADRKHLHNELATLRAFIIEDKRTRAPVIPDSVEADVIDWAKRRHKRIDDLLLAQMCTVASPTCEAPTPSSDRSASSVLASVARRTGDGVALGMGAVVGVLAVVAIIKAANQ